MATYKVYVPPTDDMGSYTTIVANTQWETKEQQALWDYNNAREHDGLEPLSRMPRGTKYTRERR